MDTYIVIRRNGWKSREELEAAAERSFAEDDEMHDLRWMRSYVFVDTHGLSTVCLIESDSPEAIERHAEAAQLPVDEVRRVNLALIVREEATPAR